MAGGGNEDEDAGKDKGDADEAEAVIDETC